jgi:choline dehydrogenase-like flavoprotein
MDADVLVIGSGPGGFAAATAAAEAGCRTVLVDAGTQHAALWEGGLRTTTDGLAAPAPRAIGGGATRASMWQRPDAACLHTWAREHGAASLDAGALAEHAAAIETWWDGVPAEPPSDSRGQRFVEAAGSLGMPVEPVRLAPSFHRDRGDPIRAAGGAVIGDVEITELRQDLGRIAGAVGRRSDGSHVRISARKTVVAAGAVGTALLLDGVAPTRPLRFHLEATLLGRLPEPLGPWTGPADGARALSLRPHGVDVDVLAPELADALDHLPADQRARRRALGALDRVVAVRVRGDAEASTGSVRTRAGTAVLDWSAAQADVDRMRLGLLTAVRLLAAMGADTVWAGAPGLPEDAAPDELIALLESTRHTAAELGLRAIHAHGTAPIGATTRADGAVVGVDDLYVADGSLMPCSPGADPQVTVMALGHAVGVAVGIATRA